MSKEREREIVKNIKHHVKEMIEDWLANGNHPHHAKVKKEALNILLKIVKISGHYKEEVKHDGLSDMRKLIPTTTYACMKHFHKINDMYNEVDILCRARREARCDDNLTHFLDDLLNDIGGTSINITEMVPNHTQTCLNILAHQSGKDEDISIVLCRQLIWVYIANLNGLPFMNRVLEQDD